MTEPLAYSVAQSFDPAPTQEFRFDRHYLLYASAGTMRLETEKTSWALPPARAALIKANKAISVTLPVRIECRSVLFSADFVPLPDQDLSVFDVSPLARELILECGQWGPADGPLSGYASGLFQTLASVAWRLARSPSNLQMPVPKSDAVRKVLELTEAGVAAPLTFESLAAEVGIAPRSLARQFSSELGMNWRQAQQRLRIIAAVEALAQTDLKVTEIAFAQGYQSLSAFNAAFRELTGQSPRDYRASFRSGQRQDPS